MGIAPSAIAPPPPESLAGHLVMQATWWYMIMPLFHLHQQFCKLLYGGGGLTRISACTHQPVPEQHCSRVLNDPRCWIASHKQSFTSYFLLAGIDSALVSGVLRSPG